MAGPVGLPGLQVQARRRGADQFEVTLLTEYHESTATAASIGQALVMAAETIQWPIPEGLPRILDLVRTVPAPLTLSLVWTP